MGSASVVSLAKMRRFAERKDRSLCVIMKNTKDRPQLEKPVMEELVKQIHSDIEGVFFPRQRVPRFFFVLCKNEKSKEGVDKAIRLTNSAELGPLFPQKVAEKEFKVKEVMKQEKKNIDPLTLVLEAIPKSLDTEQIKKQFPKCKNISRFNDRRCYVSFNDIPDAFEALKMVKNKPLCGFKITAKFSKVQRDKKEEKETQKPRKSPKKSNNNKNAKRKSKPMSIDDDEESS